MIRILFLLPLVVLVIAACATSESGEAPAPVSSNSVDPSAAGLAALSTESLDPLTCEGVLGSPPSTHTLELQSLTETVQDEVPQIRNMCAAVYETSTPGDPFLTVALIGFDSDGPAISHYDLLKNVFVTQDVSISELNNADDSLLDHFSALQDRDGIGRTTVLRQKNWVLTISNGPNTTDSLWTTDDLQFIGESVISRAQQ
jgi:hypothetical protein